MTNGNLVDFPSHIEKSKNERSLHGELEELSNLLKNRSLLDQEFNITTQIEHHYHTYIISSEHEIEEYQTKSLSQITRKSEPDIQLDEEELISITLKHMKSLNEEVQMLKTKINDTLNRMEEKENNLK